MTHWTCYPHEITLRSGRRAVRARYTTAASEGDRFHTYTEGRMSLEQKKPFVSRRLTAAAGLVAVVVALLISADALSSAPAAQGSVLYWASPTVRTASLSICYEFAEDVMRRQNFQRVNRTRSEVTGHRGQSYAAITCIGTAPRATAVVMVVGSSGPDAVRARDDLRTAISRITRID